MIFFVMRIESKVEQEAEIFATEMCFRRNFSPKSMTNWYKHLMLKLVIGQMVTNFRLYQIPFKKSMGHVR
jgi:hypothetical protein